MTIIWTVIDPNRCFINVACFHNSRLKSSPRARSRPPQVPQIQHPPPPPPCHKSNTPVSQIQQPPVSQIQPPHFSPLPSILICTQNEPFWFPYLWSSSPSSPFTEAPLLEIIFLFPICGHNRQFRRSRRHHCLELLFHFPNCGQHRHVHSSHFESFTNEINALQRRERSCIWCVVIQVLVLVGGNGIYESQ